MKKIVRLTESDLVRIVKRIINEGTQNPAKGETWKLDLGGGDVIKFSVTTSDEGKFSGTITSSSGSAFSGIGKGGKISGTIDNGMGKTYLNYKISDGRMKKTDDITISSTDGSETEVTLTKV